MGNEVRIFEWATAFKKKKKKNAFQQKKLHLLMDLSMGLSQQLNTELSCQNDTTYYDDYDLWKDDSLKSCMIGQ
jgi:hypothetical protein